MLHRLSCPRESVESETHPYTDEDLAEARHVLNGLMPSLENAYAKVKEGKSSKDTFEKENKSVRAGC